MVNDAAAIDFRHDDVGDHQADMALKFVGRFNGFHAVTGLEHAVAAVFKILGRGIAEIVFIIHQQDGFVALQIDAFLALDIRRFQLGAGNERQVDVEGGTNLQFRVNRNMPAALLDDSINRGEAQSGAVFLGGKEWFEDARFDFRIHARAAVGDRKQHILPRGHLGRAAMADVVFHVNGQGAAVGHGVARIGREVQNHLLELSLVGIHQAKIGLGMNNHLAFRAQQAMNHAVYFRHHRGDVEQFGCHDLATAEGQELFGQRGCFLGSDDNFFGFGALRFVGGVKFQKLSIAANDA